MAHAIQESFRDFYKRQNTGLNLISEAMKQEQAEHEKIRDFHEKRYLRKYELFYKNLGLIIRNKDEIINTPKYANIDAHYLLEGGGCFIGRLQTYQQYNFAGTLVTINLKLGTLLKIWEAEQFQVECSCGGIAYIRHFVGSPLSGSSCASALCSKCGQEIKGIKNRSYGKYHFFSNKMHYRDIDLVVKKILCNWSLAEEKYNEDVKKGNVYMPSVGENLKSNDEFCNLETMIHELQLKEFKVAN